MLTDSNENDNDNIQFEAKNSRPDFDEQNDRDLSRAAEEIGRPHKSSDFKSAAGTTQGAGQGDDEFERVLGEVRQAAEEDRRRSAGNSDDANRERQWQEEEAKKRKFEEASLNFPQIKETRNSPKGQVEDKKMEKFRRHQTHEIVKQVKKEMEEDYTWKQREMAGIAARIAGDRALAVLYRAAEKMTEVAEGGGMSSWVIISMTYLIAFTKDFLDSIVNVTFPFSIVICLASGLFFGSFIIMFWSLISGGRWSGGLIRNWILRFILAAFIDSSAPTNILPVYLILNFLTHKNWIKARRQAEEELEEVNQQIELIRKNVKRSVDQTNTAL